MKTKSILVLGLAFLIHGSVRAADPAPAAKPAAAPAAAAPAAKPAAAPAAAAKPAEAPAAKPAEAAAKPTDAKKVDWDHMSKADKKKYMKTTVLPAAKKLFAEFDAKKYKKVTCQTCHGAKGASEGEFKMPTAELPKLPQPTDRAAFTAMAEKKPDVVKFMGTKVKPGVAALLGKEEWTPQNPTGWGCYGCHQKEGGEMPAKEPAAAAPAAGAKEAAAKEPAKK